LESPVTTFSPPSPSATSSTSEAPKVSETAPLLAEPSVESIDDLLNRDPFGYTPADRARLISHYRALRVQFVEAEKTAKAAGKKRVALPKSDAVKIINNLSLGDLLGTPEEPPKS
jgi:hypothetical protein